MIRSQTIFRKLNKIGISESIQRCCYGVTQLPVIDEANQPDSSIANPFEKKKIKCVLCRLGIKLDYKNTKLLSQFQSRYTGRIYGRHITGLCATQHELVEKEMKKAQFLALMPYMFKHPDYVNDPPLFDPEHPIRPHRFE